MIWYMELLWNRRVLLIEKSSPSASSVTCRPSSVGPSAAWRDLAPCGGREIVWNPYVQLSYSSFTVGVFHAPLPGLTKSTRGPTDPLWSWGLSQDLFAHRVAGSRCDVTFVPGCCEAFLLEKGQVSQGWRSDPWKPFRKQEPFLEGRRRRWRWKDRGHKIWNFSSESLHDSKFHRLTLVEARKLYAWRVLITFCMKDMR